MILFLHILIRFFFAFFLFVENRVPKSSKFILWIVEPIKRLFIFRWIRFCVKPHISLNKYCASSFAWYARHSSFVDFSAEMPINRWRVDKVECERRTKLMDFFAHKRRRRKAREKIIWFCSRSKQKPFLWIHFSVFASAWFFFFVYFVWVIFLRFSTPFDSRSRTRVKCK